MKIKKIMCLVVGLIISFSAFSTVGVGSGTRGGGHTVDIDSTPYLMDLVGSAVCEWKRGDELIAELPALKDTLVKIDRLDWYFSSDLKEEMRHLNFCMTGALYSVPAYDPSSIIKTPVNERPRQVGYRLHENVYIDREIFEHMDDVNQAMLIVHETMHSYLAMDTYNRSLKLRSMVKSIDKVRQGQILTREKLHYDMRMNDIIFPFSVNKIDGRKDVVLFLKSDIEEKKNLIRKVLRPEYLINISDEEVAELNPYDRKRFEVAPQRVNALTEALLSVMQQSSPQELVSFLNNKEFQKIDIAKVALNDFYVFSHEQKEVILSSVQFARMLNSGFDEILSEEFEQRDYLIVSSINFQQLMTGKGEKVAPVSLLVRPNALPSRLMWLVETIAVLGENNSLEIILNNEKFYNALGLKNQKAQVSSMQVKFPNEKKVALERLNIISKSLVDLLLGNLRARMDYVSYDEMMKIIKLDQF